MSEPEQSDAPVWLQLLLAERYINHQSLRQLAAKSGLSHTHVGRVLQNRDVPTRRTLETIVEAITDDSHSQQRIMIAFDKEHAPLVVDDERRDAHVLAEAINNLADAIRTLAKGNQ